MFMFLCILGILGKENWKTREKHYYNKSEFIINRELGRKSWKGSHQVESPIDWSFGKKDRIQVLEQKMFQRKS